MIKKILANKSGTTLVEMVVTFALIGIFMVAVMTCISSTILTYADVQAVTSKQFIADNILNNMKANTKTMSKIQVTENGKRLEYSDSDNNYLVRIDADGFNGKYYKNNVKEFIDAPTIEEGIVTTRYYEQQEGKIVDKADGKAVCRSLQQLSNQKVQVKFEIPDDAIYQKEYVRYFNVTVEFNGYRQSKIVHLENKVKVRVR